MSPGFAPRCTPFGRGFACLAGETAHLPQARSGFTFQRIMSCPDSPPRTVEEYIRRAPASIRLVADGECHPSAGWGFVGGDSGVERRESRGVGPVPRYRPVG